jgi:predicted HNH restriction endonuclease
MGEDLKSFVITWNDASWPYDKLLPFLKVQAKGKKAKLNWRFAPTRMCAVGDEVFLLKQGKRPKGIFGYGHIAGEPYREGDTPYAPIVFDLLVDPFEKMLIDEGTVEKILETSVINHARSGISIPEDAAASIKVLLGPIRHANFGRIIPDATDFRDCLKALASDGRLTDDDKDMLIAHYNAPDQKITARQMSALLGREGQWANTTYGKLGRKVANQLNWTPPETRDDGTFIVAALVTGEMEYGSFVWTLRPQIATAMEQLGWNGMMRDGWSSEGGPLPITERKRYVWQLALERHSSAARIAKSHRGFRCEACEMTFADVYGPFGEGFIEAHHLYPLSKIADGEERPYAPADFAVLCSNCHRMIHRWRDCSDVAGFKKMLQGRKAKGG